MNRTKHKNYTPPYFDGITIFLGIFNPLRGKKRYTLAVGEGTPPYLNNFFIDHTTAVGECITTNRTQGLFNGIYCGN